ncbi:hypothetical protein BO78DRAFT_183872 [Aspergillus sclerotiicarbonarius CBS 121057]|uniref:Uncharacterized protein n=1 Tax=Aspergillus sclerotiicarbonarius (strain CBS 121057 / IBT 28362) TaxID=1448318 RepID=A0A319ESK4_ASPSB|nr:hypothetical protein BO78DRAFT_183872 [Aspergillus sclerotiicarbonarius CBS 121057]
MRGNPSPPIGHLIAVGHPRSMECYSTTRLGIPSAVDSVIPLSLGRARRSTLSAAGEADGEKRGLLIPPPQSAPNPVHSSPQINPAQAGHGRMKCLNLLRSKYRATPVFQPNQIPRGRGHRLKNGDPLPCQRCQQYITLGAHEGKRLHLLIRMARRPSGHITR